MERKPHVSFQSICFKIFSIGIPVANNLNKGNVEKGTILTASKRIDIPPTYWQRFSNKFPTAWTQNMTNAR